MLSRWLQQFRQAIYKNLCRAQDATFELMDALLLTIQAQSLADLSLSCVFRRQWSSVYEALQDTRRDREQLMKLYIAQIGLSEPIVLAGDHTRKVQTFCQNPPRTHLRTFPFTIRMSSDRRRIWLQYIGMDTRSIRQLGCTIFTRTNYQLGQSDLDLGSTIIEGEFSLTVESNIFVG